MATKLKIEKKGDEIYIWIIGSSNIKWASEHTKNRATGRDLGLDKQGYNVIWVGHQGMLWYMVDNVINIMLSWRRPPAIILILLVYKH
jgi:hypothetical protein